MSVVSHSRIVTATGGTRHSRRFDDARNIPLTKRNASDISMIVETLEGRSMQAVTAVGSLAALAQEHRLALFRLLVQAGGEGLPAGALAEALSVPNSSLSFHLAHLNRAGLIEQRREGRSLIYTANYDSMNDLVAYLMENCCGGAGCLPMATALKIERKSA